LIRLSLKQGPNLITLCSPKNGGGRISWDRESYISTLFKRKKKVSPAPRLPIRIVVTERNRFRRTFMYFL
jgi:hypothetical protein